MASVPLANNAWGLACIVCLFSFLIAPVTLTHYKYAAFLFIITLHTIILCQCAPSLVPSCLCRSVTSSRVPVLQHFLCVWQSYVPAVHARINVNVSGAAYFSAGFVTGGVLPRVIRAAQCYSTRGLRTLRLAWSLCCSLT